MNVHFSGIKDDWATPQDLFDKLDNEFDFTLDPCASEENAKCVNFYTAEQDGLTKDWKGERVFCNPPYNRYQIKKWVEKMSNSDAEVVVGLLPARTNTSWFHDFVWNKAEIRFIRGKITFGGYKWQAPFPSMIVVFKTITNPPKEE